ncbi:unnamed protein product [Symbiodinium sp. CCMP2456]|nr:unnamed protein product [Symbiodinium sp. CCMP2456]
MGEQELEGPCINVSGNMMVIAANASFVGCRNRIQAGEGGALFIQRDFVVSNSSVKFENCSARRGGGGLWAGGNFLQESESAVAFENCTAFSGVGGGANVCENFAQGAKSSAIFRSCSANSGGGLSTYGSFSQEAESTVTCENCSDGGGAIVGKNFTQGAKSSAIFRSCSANYGGGLSTGGFLQEAESAVTFVNCTSGASVASGSPLGDERVGELKASFRAAVTSGQSFEDGACQAGSDGGGAVVKKNFTQGAKSSAARTLECNASSMGGGLHMDGGKGLLKLGSAHLTTKSSSGIDISEDEMNCSSTFYANVATSAVFLCPLGTGSVGFEDLHDFGVQDLQEKPCCLACDLRMRAGQPSFALPVAVTTKARCAGQGTRRPCSQCPEGASKCLASELEMQPGLMVELEDVSRSFHCPNEAACPGGHVSQGRVRRAMCADGYRGQGCTSCSDEHAMADSSVFSCTACSKDRRVQAVQWITFLSQRAFLFALGALSAFGAKKAGDLKQSSIYLNQLMAFATISNTILAAVLQTQTAKDIKSDAANFFFSAAVHTAEAASGQGYLQDASHCPAQDSDLAHLQMVPALAETGAISWIFTQRLLAVSFVLPRLREDLVAWSQDFLFDQTLFDFTASQAVYCFGIAAQK